MNIQLPHTKEVKNRIKSGQIRLNDDLIDFNTFRGLKLDTAVDLGEWLYDRLTKDKSGEAHKALDIVSLLGFEPEVLADTNVPILQKFFKGKAILRMSKKELFVIDR